MASKEELLWWNLFADVMAEQWLLTPKINQIIRSEYEEDYARFLYTPGGRFLEIGCGVGWIGHKFAAQGMRVDGLDFSESQLEIAYRMAKERGLTDVAYFTRDLVNDDLSGRFEEYDAILVNAVLHHLSHQEIQNLNSRLCKLLAPGGKIFLYEPLESGNPNLVKKIAILPIALLIRLMLLGFNLLGKHLGFFQPHFSDAIARGYTGTSPDEKPISLFFLVKSLTDNGLTVVEERPNHCFSMAIAMSIMRFRVTLRDLLVPLVAVSYFLDKLAFKTIGWDNFGRNKSVLCTIKAIRP